MAKYTDTELLDFLQKLTDQRRFTGTVILRNSDTSRGWHLHETNHDSAVADVRQAIENYIEQTGAQIDRWGGDIDLT